MGKALLLFFFISCAIAKADKPKLAPLCFDFAKTVNTPLLKPIPLLKDEDNFEQGLAPFEVEWSAARGIVKLPVDGVLDWLLDHAEWKDVSKTKLTLEKLPSPHYLELHHLAVDANVFAFIWLHWVEEWAYRIVNGTNKAPQTVLVSYQKVEGTGHITRLCGNVLVQSTGPSSSDVFFYEEAKADRYEAQNIREMQVSNLYHLRQRIKKTSKEQAEEAKPKQ